MTLDLHAALGLEKPTPSFLVEIPEALRHLPVTARIGDFDFSKQNMVIVSPTGSGKSVVAPATEAMLRKADGKVVCLREPTKVSCRAIYSFLKEVWEPLGLRIGISTMDEKTNVESCDLLLYSDGSLTGIMGKLGKERLIVYIDEGHVLTESAEIEMAVCKRQSVPLRILSATVEPKDFLDYLPGATLHQLDGRIHPIEKSVVVLPRGAFSRDDHSILEAQLREEIALAKFEGKPIMCFLPTKRMVAAFASKFAKEIPTMHVHGEVSPRDVEKWVADHRGEASCIFATSAMATGVTVPCDRVLIADEAIDSDVRMGTERQFSGPMGDNQILQCAGRTGRLRPGTAALLTMDDKRDWADIKPRPVVGPCSKATPFNVVLALAQHGIKRNEDIDLYSKLDERELAHARAELIRMGCIELDGGLTRMGRLIGATPLEPHLAHLVHSAPNRDAKIATLAAVVMGEKGTYSLVNVKPKEAARQPPGFKMLPGDCLHVGSGPMTMAHILARYAALPYGNRAMWCSLNNLNERQMAFAFYDFRNACKPLLREDETPEELLDSVDWRDKDVDLAVDDHTAAHRSMRRTRIEGAWGRITIDNKSYSCTVDSILMAAWGKATGHYGWVSGKPRIIVPQGTGRPFVSLEMCILQESDAE